MKKVKRTLPALLGIFALALAAIGGWYWVTTSRAESEAQQHKQWTESLKPVAIEFVVTAPAETPKDQFLYVSGSAPNLRNWEAAGVQLKRGEDGKYHGTVELLGGIECAYKINRGTWSTVEKDASGEEIPNRTLKPDKPAAVQVVVDSWADGGKTVPGKITRTGDVRMYPKFHSSILGNDRTIAIYLPPGYDDNESIRYPVLYMHDGQNIFDQAESFQGVEWMVDENAEQLIRDKKITPAIIVGIYNAGEFRTDEFTPPWSTSSGKPGKADLYSKFVLEEVKPFIDQAFRTMPDRASTSMAGSSMGGLITLYMARNNKDAIGEIAVLTPHLRTADGKQLLQQFGDDWSWARGMRVFVDMGDKPGRNYPGGDNPAADAKALAAKLEAAGLKRGVDLHFAEIPGGEHNEAAWQTRSDDVLLFLFGAGPSTAPAAATN